MATYAQQKAQRQLVLRRVKQEHRKLDTANENLRRCLERKRRARTMLDNEDTSEIVRYTDAVVGALGNYQSQLGGLIDFIGSA